MHGLINKKRAFDTASGRRILLYESEAVRIAQYTQSSPGLEIGGDLFGYFAPDGSPIVFIASGSGPHARRGVTHFQQDPEFQTAVFSQLATEFRMYYIGDWHSHHSIGLSQPSGSDDSKLQDLANKNGWPRLFSLIVETESAERHPGRHASNRKTVSDVSGKSEAYGIWWNAFEYVFVSQQLARNRIVVDFQSPRNPYDQLSGEINGRCSKGSSSHTIAGPVHSGASSQTTELSIAIFQKICAKLADKLPNARMELDPEYPGGASLFVHDAGREVICGINHENHTLSVTIESAGRDQAAFGVSSSRGRVDTNDLRLIVAHIVERLTGSAV